MQNLYPYNQMMQQSQPSWNQRPQTIASQGYSYQPQPVQIPTQAPQYSYTPSQPQSDIHWVQGKSGAKAYNLEPGKSVLLMDSEANKFYIKSTDQSGMPLPLRCFRYTEEAEDVEETGKSGSPDMSQYITKADFEHMLEQYLGPLGKENSK